MNKNPGIPAEDTSGTFVIHRASRYLSDSASSCEHIVDCLDRLCDSSGGTMLFRVILDAEDAATLEHQVNARILPRKLGRILNGKGWKGIFADIDAIIISDQPSADTVSVDFSPLDLLLDCCERWSWKIVSKA